MWFIPYNGSNLQIYASGVKTDEALSAPIQIKILIK